MRKVLIVTAMILCVIAIFVGSIGSLFVAHQHDHMRIRHNQSAICLLAAQTGNQAAFKAAHCK